MGIVTHMQFYVCIERFLARIVIYTQVYVVYTDGEIFIGNSDTYPHVCTEGYLARTVTHILGKEDYLTGAVPHPLGSMYRI